MGIKEVFSCVGHTIGREVGDGITAFGGTALLT